MTNFANDAHLFAWVYALTRIEPGDFGTRGQESAEVILARNVACTPVPWWHPTSHGDEM